MPRSGVGEVIDRARGERKSSTYGSGRAGSEPSAKVIGSGWVEARSGRLGRVDGREGRPNGDEGGPQEGSEK